MEDDAYDGKNLCGDKYTRKKKEISPDASLQDLKRLENFNELYTHIFSMFSKFLRKKVLRAKGKSKVKSKEWNGKNSPSVSHVTQKKEAGSIIKYVSSI